MAVLLDKPKPDEPQVRLLVCRKCQSVEEIPDYEGPVEGDALLERVVSKHQKDCGAAMVGGEKPEVASQQDRFLVKVKREDWNNERIKKEILNRLSMSGTGFEEKVYGVKNTWQADAMECFNAHRRPEQCIDYKDKSKRIGNGFLTDEEKSLKKSSGLFTGLTQRRQQQTVFLCDFCPVKSGVQTKVFSERGLYDS